jgi:ssDNA-binding Zn-finger/Zn-ribbon topoisomerase 1
MLCTHACKWKNETCWNCSRRMVEGVNPSMIYLIHCNNFCKCHSVPPPSTIIKKEKRKKERMVADYCDLEKVQRTGRIGNVIKVIMRSIQDQDLASISKMLFLSPYCHLVLWEVSPSSTLWEWQRKRGTATFNFSFQ